MVEMNSFGICTQNSYEYIQTEKNGSHVLENCFIEKTILQY